MKMDVSKLAGTHILAQAVSGRNLMRKLLAETEHEPETPVAVYIDFASVEIATASFLRECILGFRSALRARRSNLYPVVVNPNDSVEEELAYLLHVRGDALLACDLNQQDKPTNVRLMGDLDPKHRETLDLVLSLGSADAGTLSRNDKTVTRTAWNNRLATLANLGLVAEVNAGRGKKYLPIVQEA